jgi:hypothetical protein
VPGRAAWHTHSYVSCRWEGHERGADPGRAQPLPAPAEAFDRTSEKTACHGPSVAPAAPPRPAVVTPDSRTEPLMCDERRWPACAGRKAAATVPCPVLAPCAAATGSVRINLVARQVRSTTRGAIRASGSSAAVAAIVDVHTRRDRAAVRQRPLNGTNREPPSAVSSF